MKEQPSIQHRESLVSYAKAAGIIVPANLYDTSDGFRHWNLYCDVQIERPISSSDALLHNAKVVAAISVERFESPEPFVFEEISNMLK
ncbi:MAG: hypothetical protein WC919_03275 [Candidatus Paceibacterota bacterium]|jgi:hypothetical protein